MESLWHIILWYPAFIIPAGISWFGVRAAGWHSIDLQPGDRWLLVLPWLGLCLAAVMWPGEKTLRNMAEIVILAAGVPLAMLLRVIMGRRVDQEKLARRLAWGGFFLGIFLWLTVPTYSYGPS